MFIACKKEVVNVPGVQLSTSVARGPLSLNTMPDNAMLRLRLVKDSINYDETDLIFDHLSSPDYDSSEDARYLGGFGQTSLSSISLDGISLSINYMPYTDSLLIPLDVHTRQNGTFYLEISGEYKIPGDKQVWLKDTYQKDSVCLYTQPYRFIVDHADTSSYGTGRFKIFFKNIPTPTQAPK